MRYCTNRLLLHSNTLHFVHSLYSVLLYISHGAHNTNRYVSIRDAETEFLNIYYTEFVL